MQFRVICEILPRHWCHITTNKVVELAVAADSPLTSHNNVLILCVPGIFIVCCRLLKFSKLIISKKSLSETQSECQAIWIQIRTDILSVLIWVQTVTKGHQQTTNVAASKERVNVILSFFFKVIFTHSDPERRCCTSTMHL